jgi:hypothetical protein
MELVPLVNKELLNAYALEYQNKQIQIYSIAGGFFLVYEIKKERFIRYLPDHGATFDQALANGNNDVLDEESGLHAWFDRRSDCWIIMCSQSTSGKEHSDGNPDYLTDTIFLDSAGRVKIKSGYRSGKPDKLETDLTQIFTYAPLLVAICLGCFGMYYYIR